MHLKFPSSQQFWSCSNPPPRSSWFHSPPGGDCAQHLLDLVEGVDEELDLLIVFGHICGSSWSQFVMVASWRQVGFMKQMVDIYIYISHTQIYLYAYVCIYIISIYITHKSFYMHMYVYIYILYIYICAYNSIDVDRFIFDISTGQSGPFQKRRTHGLVSLMLRRQEGLELVRVGRSQSPPRRTAGRK